MQLTKSLKIARGLSLYALLFTVGFLPIFFVPFSSVSAGVAKGYFLVIGVILSVIGFVAEAIITGKIYVPKNIISRSVIALLVVFLISSLFAPNISFSLWGLGFEMGTFSSILILSIIYYLSCYHFENQKNIDRLIKYLTGSFFFSFFIIAASLFLGKFTWFSGFFKGIYGQTPAGSWNDLVVIASIVCVLSVIRLELYQLSKKKKILNWVLILGTLLIMALVNFKTAWLVLGIFGLVSFVYILAFHRARTTVLGIEDDAKIKFPLASFAIVFFSLIFYVGNPVFGNALSSRLNFSNVDVRPSTTLSAQVFIKTIQESPKKAILGYSPNNFSNAWQKHLPYKVLQSGFWETRFSAGVSHIFTWFVTVGLLGTVVILYFMLTYCAVALRVLLRTAKTGTPDPDLVIPFMLSFLSWLYVAIYVPSTPIVVLAFSSTGLLIGVLTYKKIIKRNEFDYLPDPRGSFFSILSLVIILVLSIVSIYFSTVKFAAFYKYAKGVSSNNDESSVKYLTSAIKLSPKNDLFQRTLSVYYVGRATKLINENQSNVSKVASQISENVKLGEAAAVLATQTNSNDSLNWKNLGSFYELVQNLGQDKQNAYINGLEAYNKAQAYAPKDVSILLSKARIEYRNQNQSAAYDYISKALELKPNYAEAFVLRATFKNNASDFSGAIEDYKLAISAESNNANNYVLLANLYAKNGEYKNAAEYYRAGFIVGGRSSANIAYALADVDLKIGNKEEAKILIDKLKEAFPESEEVKSLEQRLGSSEDSSTESE